MKQSKHRENILVLVERDKIKSTRQILRELSKKTGKCIHWHMVYKNLNDLAEKGLIKRLESDAGIFWTKI